MKKIMVIGAGGIGSFLIPLLDRVNEYHINVWDDDIVEKKNLSYQDFYEDDVGKHKTDVMAKRYDMYIVILIVSLQSNNLRDMIWLSVV